MLLRMVYVVILAAGCCAWAQNLPETEPQPGRDPSGTGAIVPGEQPLPPDYDTRNPRAPRVWPTPNNSPAPPDDGRRTPSPAEDPPFGETGGM